MRELSADPTAARSGERGPARVVVLTAELVREHQAALWRYLRVLGADVEQATDLAQDAFVVLLHAGVQDHGPAALRSWLRTTARHLFLAACRARRRLPVALDAEALERAWAQYDGGDDGAGYREALDRCLELLAPQQRELLERAAVAPRGSDGPRSDAERSRLRRLKQALRECVTRRMRDDR